jgi:hypothetical protein
LPARAGSGALALPLAALLPRCTVTIVDVNAKSLAIAQRRASEAGLANLRTREGDISGWRGAAFDLGTALHACGEASDLAMEACVAAQARLVVAPCCVGKLNRARMNHVTWNATGSNDSRLEHPRSHEFGSRLHREEFDALASAADYSSNSLCYATLCYATLCYAMLRYATLRYAMLCYAMPCHAMLCCAMGSTAWPQWGHTREEPVSHLRSIG